MPSFKLAFHARQEPLRLGIDAAAQPRSSARTDTVQCSRRGIWPSGYENPASRPKCRQSAAPRSPPNFSANARAAAVLTSLLSRSGCFSQAWKLPGDVSTMTAGLKPACLHRRDCIRRQIIDHAQIMLTLGPDVDVPSFAILVAQPRHGFNDCPGIPNTRDHDRFARSRIWVVKPNFKQFGTHRRDLLQGCCGGLAGCLIGLSRSLSKSIHTARTSPTEEGTTRSLRDTELHLKPDLLGHKRIGSLRPRSLRRMIANIGSQALLT